MHSGKGELVFSFSMDFRVFLISSFNLIIPGAVRQGEIGIEFFRAVLVMATFGTAIIVFVMVYMGLLHFLVPKYPTIEQPSFGQIGKFRRGMAKLS